jgi:hypothetical protein
MPGVQITSPRPIFKGLRIFFATLFVFRIHVRIHKTILYQDFLNNKTIKISKLFFRAQSGPVLDLRSVATRSNRCQSSRPVKLLVLRHQKGALPPPWLCKISPQKHRTFGAEECFVWGRLRIIQRYLVFFKRQSPGDSGALLFLAAWCRSPSRLMMRKSCPVDPRPDRSSRKLRPCRVEGFVQAVIKEDVGRFVQHVHMPHHWQG